MTIKELQQWVEADWQQRSTSLPTSEQQMLYLIEEIGEVAEALRKQNGNKKRILEAPKLGSELADTLISLTTLANAHGIDLTNEIEQFKKRLAERHSAGY
jgi:NTP pyrophosphatase (non-canonical NTP hydrolase)